jgi:hypothetical protein
MTKRDDECIWVRAEAWLIARSGIMLKVETRKVCRGGVFLEAIWPAEYQSVEVIFPDPAANNGGHRIAGTVAERWPDGIWVEFSQELRSPVEMLMRSGLSTSTCPPAPPAPSVWASW